MHSTKSHLILASAFLLLVAAPACFADLMCYVCDDCLKVNKDTPLLACNEEFFNQGGSSEASTVTTTEATTLGTTDVAPTSSEMPTTNPTETSTTIATIDTTTVDPTTAEQSTTERVEHTESTVPAMPTPATVGPPETTTGVPTPPNEDLAQVVREVTRLSPVDSTQPDVVTATSELAIRQRRSVIDTDVSYHCYTVQKTINNTVQTERGCSRVTSFESVCKDLELQNSAIQLSNCDPCTMNACNSATSLVQSTLLATLIVVLVAAVLQRN